MCSCLSPDNWNVTIFLFGPPKSSVCFPADRQTHEYHEYVSPDIWMCRLAVPSQIQISFSCAVRLHEGVFVWELESLKWRSMQSFCWLYFIVKNSEIVLKTQKNPSVDAGVLLSGCSQRWFSRETLTKKSFCVAFLWSCASSSPARTEQRELLRGDDAWDVSANENHSLVLRSPESWSRTMNHSKSPF